MSVLETETVVAGYDGSAESRRAVWWAASEAVTRSRPLLLVQAFTMPLEELTRIHLPTEPIVFDSPHSVADEEITRMAEQCREQLPDLRVRTETLVGHPANVLLDASLRASVLVLGPPEPSRAQRVLLGSTAAELVRRAHVPVITVRGETENNQGEGVPVLERVVVGVDGSTHSLRAIAFAHDFAARHQAELTALLVHPETGRRGEREQAEPNPIETGRRELAEAMAGWGEQYPDVVVRQEVTTARRVSDPLLEAAGHADLLIVGTHGRGIVRAALLGSVSHAVVNYAECPVAIVH
ncbi:Nucleotide-binding universal stress protein, UspA family [Actinopolyspora mzabensis]|uniref:Nucleotide-binding universal stress protein, UspA family n=1 Tax=Actinopolyspora mzabensis TaxID=995066 RepID=A0A1G9EHT5_ACTMZ|nr:universal stress protein [Actinopolyspora mzabensis]SDK75595.1 Nucleotide-binding universal stress protein, UspA family [Actinopolyspora mzabensis]